MSAHFQEKLEASLWWIVEQLGKREALIGDEDLFDLAQVYIQVGADVTFTNDLGQTIFDCLSAEHSATLEQVAVKALDSLEVKQRIRTEKFLMHRQIEAKDLAPSPPVKPRML